MVITEDEKKTAEAYRAFDQTASVKELMRQYQEGLISTIELAHKIVDVWQHFKNLPQNRDVKFYN